MSNVPGIVGYLYRALATLGEEGEGWVVVTLVGECLMILLGTNNTGGGNYDVPSEGETEYLFVPVAGILIGLNAALISIVTAWLSDMKLGYCTTGWWLSQKFCCAEISAEGAACEEWRHWGGVEPFRYIAYVAFAVSLCGRFVS